MKKKGYFFERIILLGDVSIYFVEVLFSFENEYSPLTQIIKEKRSLLFRRKVMRE